MKDEDFLSYSDPQLSASLRGADACIWTLGVTPSRASDEQAFRRVTLEYTSQAAKAFNNAFTASNEGGQEASSGPKFRFVYVSGGMAERDQSKPLWFNASYRRVRVWTASHILIFRT
jgi:hypothetical protein